METKVITKETWLSKQRYKNALDFSLLFLAFVVLASFFFLNGILGADSWMPASREAVFTQHEYWRPFTTLFAHADLGHLLGNAILLFPFSYFLSGHFSRWFFPVMGVVAGALINVAVLATMPPEAQLIGISGVVYWMGAAWLTLYMLIERREPLRRRLGKFVILTAALFIPDTVRPEVSYLSHYLGFALGGAMGYALYLLERRKIQAAEVHEFKTIESVIGEEEWNTSTPLKEGHRQNATSEPGVIMDQITPVTPLDSK